MNVTELNNCTLQESTAPSVSEEKLTRTYETILRITVDINMFRGAQQRPVQALKIELSPVAAFFRAYRRQLIEVGIPLECCSIDALIKDLTPVDQEKHSTAFRTDQAVKEILQPSSSFVDLLNAALKACRIERAFEQEYLIRRLFIQLVACSPRFPRECAIRALELEAEHLDAAAYFESIMGGTQFKYDQHFSRYLDMLAWYFRISCPLNTSLVEKFYYVLQLLMSMLLDPLTQQKVGASDYSLMARCVGFLKSRKEWPFELNRTLAALANAIARQYADSEQLKSRMDLELIQLDFSQLIQGESPSLSSLQTLIKELDGKMKIKVIDVPSRIRGWELRVDLCEAIGDHGGKTEEVVREIKHGLNMLLACAEENSADLNFPAQAAVPKARFSLAFYNLFYPQDGSNGTMEVARLLIKNSRDFWCDSSNRHAGDILLEYLAQRTSEHEQSQPMTGKNAPFVLIHLFKHVLLKDTYALAKKHLEGQEEVKRIRFSIPLEMDPGASDSYIREEGIRWKFIKNYIKDYFKQGNVKYLREAISAFMAYEYLSAQSKLKHTYGKGGVDCRFTKLNTQADPTLLKDKDFQPLQSDLSDSDSLMGYRFSIDLDLPRMEKFLEEGAMHPLLIQFVAAREALALDEMEQKAIDPDCMDIMTSKSTIYTSSVEQFKLVFSTLFQFVLEKNGQLKYRDMIAYFIQCYMKKLAASRIYKNFLAPSMKFVPKQQQEALRQMRAHRESVASFGNLCICLCVFCDHILSEPFREKGEMLFRNAAHAVAVNISFAKTLKEKFFWAGQLCQFYRMKWLYEERQEIQNNLPLRSAGIKYLREVLMCVPVHEDPEEMRQYLNEILSGVPSAFKEIQERFAGSSLPSLPVECEQSLWVIAFFKACHLLFNRYYSEGMRLLEEIFRSIDSPIQRSKAKRGVDSRNSSSGLSLQIGTFHSIIDVKFKEGMYKSNQMDFIKEQPDNDLIEAETIFKEYSVARGDILGHALVFMKRWGCPAVASCVSLQPLSSVLKSNPLVLSKTAKYLFKLFWTEEADRKGVYKNDFEIRGKQVIQLIEALGGKYRPMKGTGMQRQLPCIEWEGGVAGALVDFEGDIPLCDLAEDYRLKPYQIWQFREMLRHHGFGPESIPSQEDLV